MGNNVAVEFIPIDRDTPYIFPPCVQDYLPEGHLARFVVEIVEQLDLRQLSAVYSGKGSKPYHPAMLVALLFYGYATGVFSSRKLEKATYDSIAFRYICANTNPDHDTIASFRKRFLKELADYLLDQGWAGKVVFHLKGWPFFVSDAMVRDLEWTLSGLEGHSGVSAALARRVRAAMPLRIRCRDELLEPTRGAQQRIGAGKVLEQPADQRRRVFQDAGHHVELNRRAVSDFFRFFRVGHDPVKKPGDFAAGRGIEQRDVTDAEVLERCLYPMVNEGAKILDEGIAIRGSDIDVVWVNGYGWPLYRGGPMYWGDTIGAERIYNQVAAWHQQFGDRWKPSQLLRETAEKGGKLRELKADINL